MNDHLYIPVNREEEEPDPPPDPPPKPGGDQIIEDSLN